MVTMRIHKPTDSATVGLTQICVLGYPGLSESGSQTQHTDARYDLISASWGVFKATLAFTGQSQLMHCGWSFSSKFGDRQLCCHEAS